ncbi:cytochrome c oxidase assembly protein [Arthrobacter crystallopoietes]|uniref:Putative copper resistance protein D n=1 Tax=Crystallibacter crystallopoietes TaxID=37928 RepID=A0A1H1FXC2_9MICC|nr:cytochrome c oxidase assembly protein [Arthrobacter crystallopoietes]SDR05565.1 putative copper resistance protein D [Arthrobacter crystallopoietes]
MKTLSTRHTGTAGPRWLTTGVISASAAALITAVAVTGIAAPRLLADPGAIVRWGLPAATTLHHLAMAVTLGALAIAAAVLPRATGNGRPHPAREQAMAVASAAATVWTLAAASVLILAYADTVGLPVSGSLEFTEQLAFYMTNHILGRTWLSITVISAIVATLAFAVRSPGAVTATTLLAATAVVPLSLIGHVAGSDDHNGAANALALHLLGASLWTGGVITLGLIAGRLTASTDLMRATLRRFSVLAITAFALVVTSGVINTAYRIGGWDGLVSTCGSLVVFKTMATLALGYIGFEHRRWIAGKTGTVSARRLVWQLISVEIVVLGAVMAVAAVLGKTPPPVPRVPEPPATPANILTGYDLPSELTASSLLTQWRWDWLWIAVAVILAVAYLTAVRRLRTAGTPWPVRRSVAWLAGLALLVYVTSGAPTVYGPVLFGMHTAAHLLLIFAVPLLLTAARPYLLASKALPRRTDGTLGWREAMSLWPDSGPGRLLSRPAAAGVLTAVALAVFYYSPLFRWSLSDHVGHELMITASLVIGLVLAAAVLGTRPRSGDRAGVFTLLGLCALLVLWAVYTAALGQPVQGEWFASLGRTDAAGVLADFRSGAVAMLLAGTVPLLCAAAAIALRSGLTRRL